MGDINISINGFELAKGGLAILISVALWAAVCKLPVANDGTASGRRRVLGILSLLAILLLTVIGAHTVLGW